MRYQKWRRFNRMCIIFGELLSDKPGRMRIMKFVQYDRGAGCIVLAEYFENAALFARFEMDETDV